MKEFMSQEAAAWITQVAVLIPQEKNLVILTNNEAFNFSQAIVRLFDEDEKKFRCNINHLSLKLISEGYIDSVFENYGPDMAGDELVQDVVARHLANPLCNHVHAPHTVLVTSLAVDGIVQNVPFRTHMDFWKVSSASRKKMQEVIDKRKSKLDTISTIDQQITELLKKKSELLESQHGA